MPLFPFSSSVAGNFRVVIKTTSMTRKACLDFEESSEAFLMVLILGKLVNNRRINLASRSIKGSTAGETSWDEMLPFNDLVVGASSNKRTCWYFWPSSNGICFRLILRFSPLGSMSSEFSSMSKVVK